MIRPSRPWRALLSSVTALAVIGCATRPTIDVLPTDRVTGPAAKNLVLLIADGAGMGSWSVAMLERGSELAVSRMPVVGLVDTRNASGGITDSAAGATAYATGMRTSNGSISVAPRCRELWRQDPVAALVDRVSCAPQSTLLELAEAEGKATGLITTTAVTDATPAAFAAHAPDRSLHPHIASQMLASGVDVLMGGGRAVFDGTLDPSFGDRLRAVCARADCPADAAALAALAPSGRRLIGLFSSGDMARAGSRAPDLPTMTRGGLERLALDDDGFFLLVETEGTDTEQHANQPIDVIRAEMAEFDRAVGVALDFATENGATLVVVTADHETGGMALQRSGGAWTLAYTSGDHTASLVPLFAAGPGAHRLAGVRANEEVGRVIRDALLGDVR